MLFILVLALLIFGPKRLPEAGRTIGKGMAQFRKATSDLKRTIETEIALEAESPKATSRAATPARHSQPQLPGASPAALAPAPAPVERPDEPVEVLPAVETDAGTNLPS